MQSSSRTIFGFAAALLFSGVLPAGAQGLFTAYDDAFSARIASPADNGTLAQFVTVAVNAGQYDQAISSIEQYLIQYPRDARARLAASRLYYHVGSYELARRQVQYGIEVGGLTAGEQQEAVRLLGRIDRALRGVTWELALTGGVFSAFTNFAPGGAQDEESFVSPYGRAEGFVRWDLGTPSADALVLSGSLTATERFFTEDLSVPGSDKTFVHGNAAITWDKGLPNSGIDSLRLLLSAFTVTDRFDSDIQETGIGLGGRFLVRPTVETTLFAGGGYIDLSASQGIFADSRVFYEAGGSYRFRNGQALGLRFVGSNDFASGSGEIGRSYSGEVRYGGLLMNVPDLFAWSHQIAFSAGHSDIPDLSVGIGTNIKSDFWRIASESDFQLTEAQKISVDLAYRETTFAIANRDRKSFEMLMSYTLTLN
ncbi:MAG: tetratricopeptide repeat protein [Mesorhizobium sp.]|uniref:tetratricopeptide repeat protein n=2 Tax=unclassified Mesorhizobium TaxID=325217 RepID=UPI000FCC1E0E|nr:tetratricopeptide repeat protein [Mesorhizobium sp. M7A.F.Ca.ET.027.02.1.1]RUV34119.1 tetratricopeptide repeat protein [Mesorhizobium sp. M7A.F.Ca.MR.148.00.0.0]RWD09231.1 MAG: tetratricopeptide repeat protein [Mesorhizobium sp.]RVD19357.1 tetratricopeptide repeat protein [Mesorhizobium sp. M7A.F.Ca.ET.027.02.1.1]RWN48616.1 MAG: tetratricopeptide repeat protein [Mesorhizobium sp.]RWP86027.1 MAG: tetratricopeptide repeat protein [Mesorhizobium sp.]